MNKVDEEILSILKETFRKKSATELHDPDEATKEFILKFLLFFTLIFLVLRIAFGDEVSAHLGSISATMSSIFFGILFIHINNKLEEPSIIMFGLTWLSLTFGVFIA